MIYGKSYSFLCDGHYFMESAKTVKMVCDLIFMAMLVPRERTINSWQPEVLWAGKQQRDKQKVLSFSTICIYAIICHVFYGTKKPTPFLEFDMLFRWRRIEQHLLRTEHLTNLSWCLTNTLARLLTRYFSEGNVLFNGRPAKPWLSAVYKLFTWSIFNITDGTLDETRQCKKAVSQGI